VNAGVKGIGGLWIDAALPHHAAESLLQVGGRAAEPVVKVEMAEGGIEVIAPEEAHDPPPKPHTFRIARRAGNLPARFRKLIDAALAAFPCLGRARCRLGIAALGGCGGDRKEDGAQRDREGTQYLVTHLGFVSPLWFIRCDVLQTWNWVSIVTATTVFVLW
jgi:hypothetical protein